MTKETRYFNLFDENLDEYIATITDDEKKEERIKNALDEHYDANTSFTSEPYRDGNRYCVAFDGDVFTTDVISSTAWVY